VHGCIRVWCSQLRVSLSGTSVCTCVGFCVSVYFCVMRCRCTRCHIWLSSVSHGWMCSRPAFLQIHPVCLPAAVSLRLFVFSCVCVYSARLRGYFVVDGWVCARVRNCVDGGVRLQRVCVRVMTRSCLCVCMRQCECVEVLSLSLCFLARSMQLRVRCVCRRSWLLLDLVGGSGCVHAVLARIFVRLGVCWCTCFYRSWAPECCFLCVFVCVLPCRCGRLSMLCHVCADGGMLVDCLPVSVDRRLCGCSLVRTGLFPHRFPVGARDAVADPSAG